MSMTNWMHLEGRITNIESRAGTNNDVEYKIRVSASKTKYQCKNASKKAGQMVESDFPELIAYGTERYDPWVELAVGDDCVIEAECCAPIMWNDTPVSLMAIFVRASWLDKGKLNAGEKKQAERLVPKREELAEL